MSDTNVILGHEVVLENNSGELYVLNNEICCNECEPCQNNLNNHCENMSELGVNQHGGYAQYMIAPISSVYKLPKGIDKLGVFVEPLACALHALERVRDILDLNPQIDILMLGAGVASRLLSIALKHDYPNACLYFFDKDPLALNWCEEFGEIIHDINKFPRVNMVVELVGKPSQTLAGVEQYLRAAGFILIYGMPHKAEQLHSDLSVRRIFDNEWTLLSSKAGCNDATIHKAIKLIEATPMKFSQMIGKDVPLVCGVQEILHFDPRPATRSVVFI